MPKDREQVNPPAIEQLQPRCNVHGDVRDDVHDDVHGDTHGNVQRNSGPVDHQDQSNTQSTVNNEDLDEDTAVNKAELQQIRFRIAQMKTEKTKAKTAFTKARRKVIAMIERQSETTNKNEMREISEELAALVEKMDRTQETVMQIMSDMSYEFLNSGSLEEFDKISEEMEKVENEYTEAENLIVDSSKTKINQARVTATSITNSNANRSSQSMSQQSTSTFTTTTPSYAQFSGAPIQSLNQQPSHHFSVTHPSYAASTAADYHLYTGPGYATAGDFHPRNSAQNYPYVDRGSAQTDNQFLYQDIVQTQSTPRISAHPYSNLRYPVPAMSTLPERGHSSFNSTTHSQGGLKRVSIPKFAGDKRNYEAWKAAFYSCVNDNDSLTAEFKLLHLRDSLQGEALKSIASLGHSAAAYDAAKNRLEKKYGGNRRGLMLRLEELDSFRQLRDGNEADLERFSELIDVIVVHMKEAERECELGNGALYHTLQKKFNKELLAKYREWLSDKSKPENVESLQCFIDDKAEFLTTASETLTGITKDKKRDAVSKSYFSENDATPKSPSTKKCPCCSNPHGLWECGLYKDTNINKRWEIAKAAGACFRCLGQRHRGVNCKRTKICGIAGCKDNHHRLLHRESNKSTENIPGEKGSQQIWKSSTATSQGEQSHATISTTMATKAGNDSEHKYISLRTIPIIVKHGQKRVKVNALLDDASTSTYINAGLAGELGVKGEVTETSVNVLNGKIKTFLTMPVKVGIESLNRKVDMIINAKTVQSVTGKLQAIDWNKYSDQFKHLKDIQFPKFGRRETVDLLVGSDYPELHQSLRDVVGRSQEPIARLTRLGWTCVGPVNVESNEETTNFSHAFFTNVAKQAEVFGEINETLRNFWEIEKVGARENGHVMSPTDRKIFEATKESIKMVDGRYQIDTPWKGESCPQMPNSKSFAEKRLYSTESKLIKNKDTADSYSNVIAQYEKKGYIKKVTDIDRKIEAGSKCYLPHFAVIRPDKSTTKTRVVFDASAKVEGVSLNDAINQGPKLQRELFDVLLRFRKNPVALVCDIAEMYLQISLNPRDRPYYRFLWRDLDQERPPDVYEFQRVVFGVNSSPFLAQLVSQEHARLHQSEYPMAAETVLQSTYMDDSMDSVEDEKAGCQLYKELSALWKGAKMHPRKWLSNSSAVLAEIPEADRASEINLEEGQLPSVKTLGVLWQAEEDVFAFKLAPPADDFRFTKRNLLRKIATIFDPLGLVSPYVIRGKMIMQEVWMSGADWDDELPVNLEKKAEQWLSELTELGEAKVPRCLRILGKLTVMEIHAFGDASKDAYASALYARSTYDNGTVAVRLIASKTRVAPLESISIPRLEMMAAVLNLHLAETVTTALRVPMKAVTFWSDSLNVLWWIRDPSRKLKPFIAHRVGEIQSSTEPSQWRYVPTKQNPADLPSRGETAAELVNKDLWWSGPEYLLHDPSEWPENRVERGGAVESEMKKSENVHFTIPSIKTGNTENIKSKHVSRKLDPRNHSSWIRLTRLHAWINRFTENSRRPKMDRKVGELTSSDLQEAEKLLIRQAQKEAYSEEYTALMHGRELLTCSKIKSLNPRLDEDMILRLNGRLVYAEKMSYNMRYPIILPRKHPVTQLIVQYYHSKGEHACGTNQVMAELSAKYWIPGGREEVRNCEMHCLPCKLKKARITTQLMAPLPRSRVTQPIRAFSITSVDYAGPFLTKQGRGRVQTKRYLCLFTCHASRAVHLEMAYALDTNSFLNAFNRFINRRGVPIEMTSDNGSNFVGADRELMELVTQLDQDRIIKESTTRGIKWSFNPPLGPHFGGIHESLVKSAKRALHATLHKADITDEELCTGFTGAEALLNSRPLTYQSADFRDEPPITPNHFLHGSCGGQLAPDIIDGRDFNPRRRWRLVQELIKHFWSRWMKEWLPLLQQRHKWKDVKKDVHIGDVVIVADPGSTRGEWPLGRVLEVYPGKDGHVRVARIQVGIKTMLRPIVRLCPLEVGNAHDSLQNK